MPESQSWRRYLRFWGSNVDADVDDELRFHIDARTDELISQGLAPGDARARAEHEFGDVARVGRAVRALDVAHERRLRVAESLDGMWRDVRYAARSLSKARSLAAVIVLTLALGIGVNTVVFSIVNAYLFRPLPTPYANRLVVMGITEPTFREPHEMSFPDYVEMQRMRDVFVDVAAYWSSTVALSSSDGPPERIWIDVTTPNLFSAIGIGAAVGRTLVPSDGVDEPPQQIVLSYAFWQRRFNGDPRIVGDTIRIDGHPMTVVGVAREGFRGVSAMISVDGWMPVDGTPATRATRERRGGTHYNIIGRLNDGASLARARAAVRTRARQLQAEFPATNKDLDIVVVPEAHARPVLTISGPVPLMSIILIALTGLVLLVACANVASLLLARATARGRELAVRAALGASRWRLVRQSLAESLLLALGGAAGAVVLARWASAKLGDIRVATNAPVHFDFSLDWRVLAVTLGTALLTVIVAGVLPALRGASVDPQSVLAGGGRAITDRRQQRLRNVLVVAQIAVSTIVLVAAGLFARSMRQAEHMDLGFRTDRVLTMTMDLDLTPDYTESRGRAFYRELLDRVRALPEVRSAVIAARIPFGYSNSSMRVTAAEMTTSTKDESMNIFYNVVSPGYFRTVGPAIVRGRDFATTDDSLTPHVAVINEMMAKRMWPAGDALGKRFRIGDTGRELAVVGITRTAKWMSIGEEPRPFFYVPFAQHYDSEMMLQVETKGDPIAVAQPIRQIVRAMDASVPLFDVRSMQEHLLGGRALLTARLGAMFGATFGFLVLALAAVGVYGVVSYSVSSRTREIGIRIALGARVPSVLRLVVRRGLVLCLFGIVAGFVTAFGMTRILTSILYDVDPADPLTYVSVGAGLAVVALVASFIPARRATHVDPSTALRVE